MPNNREMERASVLLFDAFVLSEAHKSTLHVLRSALHLNELRFEGFLGISLLTR